MPLPPWLQDADATVTPEPVGSPEALGRYLSKNKSDATVTPEPVGSPPPSFEQAGTGGGPLASSPKDYQGPRASDFGVPPHIAADRGGDFYLALAEANAQGTMAGRLGIDVATERNRLTDARVKRRIRDWEAENPGQEVPNITGWYAEELERSHKDIHAWREERMRTGPTFFRDGIPAIWVDTDPEGRHAALREWVREGGDTGNALLDYSPTQMLKDTLPGVAAFHRRMAGPLIGKLMGASEQVFLDMPGDEQPPGHITYNEESFMGGLNWLGRFGLVTEIATSAVAAGIEKPSDVFKGGKGLPTMLDDIAMAYGSDEQLKLVERGEDIITLADDLSLGDMLVNPDLLGMAAVKLGIISEETLPNSQDYQMAFLLTMVDPDLVSIVTMGTGKALPVLTATRKALNIAPDIDTSIGLLAWALRWGQRSDWVSDNIKKVVALDAAGEVLVDMKKAATAADAGAFTQNLAVAAAVKGVQQIKPGDWGGATLTKSGDNYIWKKGEDPLVVTIASKNVPQKDLTPETIQDFIEQYPRLWGLDEFKPGIFFLNKTNKAGEQLVSIDLNVVVKEGLENRALRFAADNNQKSIWDYRINDEIKTGGTGVTEIVHPDVAYLAARKLINNEHLDVEAHVAAQRILRGTPEIAAETTLLKKVGGTVLREVKALATAADAGDEAELYSRAVEQTLRILDGVSPGLRLATENYTLAMLGWMRPLSTGTYRAIRWTGDARRSFRAKYGPLEEEMLGVQELKKAATKAGSGVAKGLQSTARMVDDYTTTQLQHMADEMVHADLKANYEAMRRLGQGQEAVDSSVDRIDEIRTGLVAALEELHAAQKLMAAAADQKAFHVAEGAYQQASSNYRVMSQAATEELGKRALEMTYRLMKDARKAADETHGAMMKPYIQLKRKKLEGFDVRGHLNNHMKVVSKMRNSVSKSGTDRRLMEALAKAIEDMKRGYKKTIEGIEDGDPMLANIRDQKRIEATTNIKYFKNNVVFWGLAKMAGIAKDFYVPAAKYWALDDEEAQGILSAGMGMWQRWTHDIVLVTEDAVGEAATVSRIHELITSKASINGSFMNVAGEEDMWAQAIPIIRALAKQPGHNPVVDALTNIWFPTGAQIAPGVAGRIQTRVKDLLMWGGPAPRGKKARLAAKAKAEALTFVEFMTESRRITLDELGKGVRKGSKPIDVRLRTGIGKVLPEELRATVFAAQAVGQAAIMGRVGRLFTAKAGTLSQDTLRAAADISQGLGSRTGESYSAAIEVLDALGIPSNQRTMMKGYFQEMQAGLVLLSDPTTRAGVIIPRQFMARMTERSAAIVKTAEAFSADGPGMAAALQVAAQMIRVSNTALVTGIFLGHPRQFTNIFLGNFSQMWATPGIGLTGALKISAMTIPYVAREVADRIPYIGKHLKAARVRMADKLGVSLEGVLPSITEVSIDPRVAAFWDPDIAANSDPFKLLGGETTWGKIRDWALEQGITTSFAESSGLMSLAQRNGMVDMVDTMASKFGGLVVEPQRQYLAMMDALEQRQRISLFLELLSNGHSPQEAGRLVKEALYDWNEPMTYIESQLATKWFMFWSFMRRALQQSGRNMLKPLIEGASGDLTVKDIFLKSSSGLAYISGREAASTAKLMEMHKGLQAMKEASRDRPLYEGEDPKLRLVWPWYAALGGNMTWMNNMPLDGGSEQFFGQYGLDYTHVATTMPAFTPIELTNTWFDIMRGVAMAATGDLHESAQVGFDVAESLSGRLTEPALEGVRRAILGGGAQYDTRSGMKNVKRLADRDILEFFGVELSETSKTPGMVQVSPSNWRLYKLLTPISMELSDKMEPFYTRPGIRDGEQRYDEILTDLAWITSQYLNLGRERYHNPAKTVQYNVGDVKGRITKEIKKEREARPLGSGEKKGEKKGTEDGDWRKFPY